MLPSLLNNYLKTILEFERANTIVVLMLKNSIFQAQGE